MRKTVFNLIKPSKLMTVIACTFVPGLAMAYVGPGAGISVLGALWGLIIGVLMAIGVILFWPIRMMIRKSKAKKAAAAAGGAAADAEDLNEAEQPAAQSESTSS